MRKRRNISFASKSTDIEASDCFMGLTGKKPNILDYTTADKAQSSQHLRVVKCGNSEEVEQIKQYCCF